MLAVATLATRAVAQPAPEATPGAPPTAQRPDDVARARDLYRSAEAAMKDGRIDDALRDYGAAYELSKDPALFFKIGRANERAGKCDVALTYYARYLREGKPSPQFAAATQERIAACGGARPDPGQPGTPTEPTAPTARDPRPDAPASGATKTDATTGAATTGAATTGAATTGAATTGAATTGAAGAPAETAPAGSAVPSISHSHKAAWLVTGGAIALTALGGVLAYAARSSENDVRDLYVGLGGQPPAFDAATRKRYDELIDQGHSYQHLSWTAFGLAGAAAAGAAVLFVLGRDERDPARITPVVTTSSAGVALRF